MKNFKLSELVFIVSVIVVLASLPYPVFSQAKRVSCIDKLRALTEANMFYALDNADHIAAWGNPKEPINTFWTWTRGIKDLPYERLALGGYLGKKPASVSAIAGTYKSRYFKCPSDKANFNSAALGSTSYYGVYINKNDEKLDGALPPNCIVRRAVIGRDNGNAVIFSDIINGMKGYYGESWNSTVDARGSNHTGFANAAYLDGHVSTHKHNWDNPPKNKLGPVNFMLVFDELPPAWTPKP